MRLNNYRIAERGGGGRRQGGKDERKKRRFSRATALPFALRRYRLQDLGLEPPNWFGYSDYGEMVKVMGTYVQGVEDTSGEAVVKVPPKPAKEVPRGLEEVATYLYAVSRRGWSALGLSVVGVRRVRGRGGGEVVRVGVLLYPWMGLWGSEFV